MVDITTVTKRSKLPRRREPYWHKLGAGNHLGYRSTEAGGTWLVRHYTGNYGKQIFRTLGDLTNYPNHARYEAALEMAREWLKHIGSGGSVENITVGEACLRYMEEKRQSPGAKGVSDDSKRLERLLFSRVVPLADIPLTKLAHGHVLAWRRHIERLPALVTRTNRGAKTTRKRSASTVNRDMVPLRAALNSALENGFVLTDIAWRKALKPIKDADRRRGLYLDRGQRLALIENLAGNEAPFARGLCLLPLRPGALAALQVKDFDARKHELRVLTDKSGEDRHILLPHATSAFLAKLARDKLPAAPLFAQWNGAAWNKDAWKKPIKAAANAAGLPAEVTAYTLRHSTITDLVTGGLDLLTIAQISGTSAAMIERHYGHLQKQRAADALAMLAI
jgi:site-specific recombinase XerD